MDKLIEYGKTALVALFISLLVFMLMDIISGKSVRSSGIVVEKHFREERIYLTTRTTTDSKGRTRTYPEIQRDPPEWIIYVQCFSGEVVKIDCSAEVYYGKEKGELMPFKTRYGGMTHLPYFRTGTSE